MRLSSRDVYPGLLALRHVKQLRPAAQVRVALQLGPHLRTLERDSPKKTLLTLVRDYLLLALALDRD